MYFFAHCRLSAIALARARSLAKQAKRAGLPMGKGKYPLCPPCLCGEKKLLLLRHRNYE
jgi:hypothetical protein